MRIIREIIHKQIASHLIISYILLALAIGLTFAQEEDETIFPPITPDNRTQVQMMQMLSQGHVHQLDWSPDGNKLAVSATGGTWIYDLAQPNIPAHHIEEHKLNSLVVFAPNHDIYISYTPKEFCPYGHCETGQGAYIHDANTHEVLHEIFMYGMTVQFIRNGEYMVINSYSHGIVIWRTDSFRENIGRHPSEFYQCQIRTQAPVYYVRFSDDESDIISIYFSDDNQWLFLIYADGHMILWDLTTDTLIERWENAIGTNLSPDKSKIAWSAVNGIFIWDIAKREQTRLNYSVHTGNRVMWSDSDNTMVTYGEDERHPVITDYGHRAMGFFVWMLTKSGFEIRWSYPKEIVLLNVADDFIMTMNDDIIEFLDTTTGELVTSFAPNDCPIGDNNDPFCVRWDAIRASRYAPMLITPYVVRDGNLLTVIHPDYPNYPMTYIIPNHIASQLDTFTNPQPDDIDEEVEWVIATSGDLLVRFGYTVYNVTQDTAMRMGYVSAPDDFCDDECYPFPFYKIWFSQDGGRLFASGWAENAYFPGSNDIISAWDIQTGRHLYNIRGDVDRFSDLSSDEQFVFLIGYDAYVGGGKILYNRSAWVFDAFTGELILHAETFDESANDIEVSPNRRFVIVYSDEPRLWAVVEGEGVQP